MRPGMVATIRVNPKDCMAVLDVMDVTGIPTDGMSFPAMVSLTLSSLLQTARDNGQIPVRTGFEYADMMGHFHQGNKQHKKKMQITNEIHRMGSRLQAPPLSPPPAAFELPQPKVRDHERDEVEQEQQAPAEPFSLPVPKEPTGDELRARRRLTELLQKKDLADDGSVTWQSSDEREYQQLYKVVYPEG